MDSHAYDQAYMKRNKVYMDQKLQANFSIVKDLVDFDTYLDHPRSRIRVYRLLWRLSQGSRMCFDIGRQGCCLRFSAVMSKIIQLTIWSFPLLSLHWRVGGIVSMVINLKFSEIIRSLSTFLHSETWTQYHPGKANVVTLASIAV